LRRIARDLTHVAPPDPRADRRVCLLGRLDSYFYYDLGGSIGWCAVDTLFIVRPSSGATHTVEMNERLIGQEVPSYLDRLLDDQYAALR
jgi:hypothetical protein